jgi:hypothetical protein
MPILYLCSGKTTRTLYRFCPNLILSLKISIQNYNITFNKKTVVPITTILFSSSRYICIGAPIHILYLFQPIDYNSIPTLTHPANEQLK